MSWIEVIDTVHGHTVLELQPTVLEVVEGGEQLPLGEVARRAEQHQRVGDGLTGRDHADGPLGTSWCPPNCERIADSTLCATSPRSRE